MAQTTTELRGSLRGVWRYALRVFGYGLGMAVASLVLTGALMPESMILRILFNGALLAVFLLLLYSDAITRGEKETARREGLAHRAAEGRAAPTADDLAACYHPAKGVLGALLGALPALCLAVALALLARPATYALQDLPGWLAYYRRRADIGLALSYYDSTAGLAATDVIRLLVRVQIMPLANIVTPLGEGAALLLDRLSPLPALLPALVYALGYLRGPALRRRVLARNEEAKRKHLRKVTRKQRARRNKKGPESLI
ncbi:MAG: hypothetical protein LBU67_03660 [Oscillospiraceae bacterium]|jgi:hypothetical protein|nr:hypothetical protein [Oscillospiraceae bacterium]